MAVQTSSVYVYADAAGGNVFIDGDEITFRGIWDMATGYAKNDSACIGNANFIALVDGFGNLPPISSSRNAYWSELILYSNPTPIEVTQSGSDAYARALAEKALETAWTGTHDAAAISTKNEGVDHVDGEALALGRTGDLLGFRRLIAGNSIQLTATGSNITITAVGTAAGEPNTASNAGAPGDGTGLALPKVGFDLPFRRIAGGPGVAVTSTGSNLVVSVTTATDPLSQAAYALAIAGTNAAATALTTAWTGTSAALAASNLAFTAFNTATAAQASSDAIQLSDAGGTLDGSGLSTARSGANLPIKRLAAGANITLVSTGSNVTVIASGNSAGEANTASNSGSVTDGIGLFISKSGTDLSFRRVFGTNGVTIIATGSNAQFSTPDLYPGLQAAWSGTATANAITGTNLGITSDGEGVATGRAGISLPFKRIIAGNAIALVATGSNITIHATGTSSGEANTASSAGAATDGFGLTLAKSGPDLPFRRLSGSSGVLIISTGSNLQLSAPDIYATLATAWAGTSAAAIANTVASTALLTAWAGTAADVITRVTADKALLTSWIGTNASTVAFTALQTAWTGTNAAASANSLAFTALQTAWTGTSVATAANSQAVIALAAANGASAADAVTRTTADKALTTAWTGTAADVVTRTTADKALVTAWTGTNSATGANSLAFTALQTAWTGTSSAANAGAVAYTALLTAWTGTAADVVTRITADKALTTAWSGTTSNPLAYLALQTAWTGTATANAITGTNLGISADGEGLATGRGGVSLPFKRIAAGNSISVVATGSNITISATGSAAGESNTSSNAGAASDGVGLALPKNAFDLPFKRVQGINGIFSNSTGSNAQLGLAVGGNYRVFNGTWQLAEKTNGTYNGTYHAFWINYDLGFAQFEASDVGET